jgi:quinol monooxygenase YgiN
MILVAGSVKIRSESREQAIQLAIWMQQATQVETGCISYRFSSDLEQPDTIHIFERWTDAAALKAHFATLHMAQSNAQLGAFLLEKPQITQYEIQQHQPL